MLPSHLIDPTKQRNEPLSHTRLGMPPPPPMPSLCVTGAMCQQGRMDAGKGIVLAYCIFRPRQLKDTRRPPLVVLHGGPSIPSNYLLPIVNGVIDRTIVFYDQWGCGKSSRPPPNTKFSIDTMIEHLHQLLTLQWGLEAYHLLGHSFGGILAYEYLLKHADAAAGQCRSVILASTPTSASLIERESKRLFRQVNNLSLTEEDEPEQEDDAEPEDRAGKQQLDETFRQTYECRLVHTPLALMDALAQAGPTPWRGIQAIADYQAEGSLSDEIPSLLLVGEYDFCTTACVEGWTDLLSNPQTTTLTNCSHYGMLEDERQYGKAITDFVHQHDELK